MNESTEVRTDGNSLLKAVYLRRLRLTRLLLEGGAYINESNEHGETPLMVSCKTHHTDAQSVPKHKMVRYLLDSGADPNIQDKAGKTALMHACLEQAGAEILSLLLNSGADPGLEDHAGLSALVYAVNTGDKDVLNVLLDACKAKGKEVIIITTNKLPSGHQMTKQYLNVPPPPDLEERLHYTPMSCFKPPSQIQLRPPPQGASANTSPLPGSPLLGLRACLGSGPGLVVSQPGSPTQDTGPWRVPCIDKLYPQRLHTESWQKSSASLLLQQSKATSLTEELVDITPEEELSNRIDGLSFHGKTQAVSRHNSVDVKDATGLLKTLELVSVPEGRGRSGKRGLGRKMSYDSATGSPQYKSYPNLYQGGSSPCPQQSVSVDKVSSECLPHMAVSSLQNVVCRRNIGMDHYSSDSQLQFDSHHSEDSTKYGGPAGGAEKRKLIHSRSSTLSGSRESLEGIVPRRSTTGLERRGSGALLLDHISYTRPGYLPPLNPHAPIPDIGVNAAPTCPLSSSCKSSNAVLLGSKPILPCAPALLRDPKVKKMLLRRHSMQIEQIKQLGNFEQHFGH